MIRIDRCHRRHRHLADRIEQTADHYGRTAARKLGGRLPDVRILVTDSRGMVRTLCKADDDLAGVTSRTRSTLETAATWWYERHDYGATVYHASGLLVVINGDAHHGYLRQLDRTLIHELAHTVQLNQPGVRQQHTTYQRMRLRVEKRDHQFLTDYVRQMDVREQQAANFETLA